MRLSLKQLKKYSFETLSGTKLGKAFDLIFDIDSQSIVQYIVKPSMISSDEYLINRDQVIKFEKEKIIVDDNVSAEKSEAKSQKNQKNRSPEPVAMRKNS
jgi:sporulation protein YlmC with PRC-barrel domain